MLIEEAFLELGRGFTVLTGETGAGKSIILDSLGLVLGDRADSGLIRHGQEQAYVIAEFAPSPEALQYCSEKLDLVIAEGENIVIKRTLQSDGKSRASINNQPINIGALKELAENLVEIVSQHEQSSMLTPSSQIVMLDTALGNPQAVKLVAAKYGAFISSSDAIAKLNEQINQALREKDYLEFSLAEFNKLSPDAGEEELLSERRRELQQLEKSESVIKEAISYLAGGERGEGGALGMVYSAEKLMVRNNQPSGHSTNKLEEDNGSDSETELFAVPIMALERAHNAIEEALNWLEGATRSNRNSASGGQSKIYAMNMEEIEDRLYALRALARKHGTTVDELHNLQNEINNKLRLIEQAEVESKRLEAEYQSNRKAFMEEAGKLSQLRKVAAEKLVTELQNHLAELKLQGSRFVINITEKPESDWSARGMDRVEFLVATNPSMPLSALAKVASGGELSRLLLAMKVAISKRGKGNSTASIIFDEIDTGVGGAVADAVGLKLKSLATTMPQVIAITHQPQVAGKADKHYLINKKLAGKSNQTSIAKLSDEQRIEELARMLSGAEITDEARKQARKLTSNGEAIGEAA